MNLFAFANVTSIKPSSLGSSEGALQYGWQTIDGEQYYFNTDGTMHTGWLEEEGGIFRAWGWQRKGHLLGRVGIATTQF